VAVDVAGSGSGVAADDLPEDDEEEAMEALDEDVEAAPPPAYGYYRPPQFEGSTLTPATIDKKVKVRRNFLLIFEFYSTFDKACYISSAASMLVKDTKMMQLEYTRLKLKFYLTLAISQK
jgi:hypothetical protein